MMGFSSRKYFWEWWLRSIIISGFVTLAQSIATILTLGFWPPNWDIAALGWEIDYRARQEEKEKQ